MIITPNSWFRNTEFQFQIFNYIFFQNYIWSPLWAVKSIDNIYLHKIKSKWNWNTLFISKVNLFFGVLWGVWEGYHKRATSKTKRCAHAFSKKKQIKYILFCELEKKNDFIWKCVFFSALEIVSTETLKDQIIYWHKQKWAFCFVKKKKCWLWRAGDLKESMRFSSEQSSSTLGISFQLEHCFCSWISSFITALSSFQRWSPNGVDV